jgi:hypothetical protein
MSKQRVDVEGILNTLATIRDAVRQQLPQLANAPATASSGEMVCMDSFVAGDEEAMEAFEMETIAEALESFSGELSASIDAAQEKATVQALEIYYAAEKLAREPEHAILIPYVERMRTAYRLEFGEEIPER